MRVKDGKALAIVSDVLATLCAESFGGVVISLLRREGRAAPYSVPCSLLLVEHPLDGTEKSTARWVIESFLPTILHPQRGHARRMIEWASERYARIVAPAVMVPLAVVAEVDATTAALIALVRCRTIALKLGVLVVLTRLALLVRTVKPTHDRTPLSVASLSRSCSREATNLSSINNVLSAPP